MNNLIVSMLASIASFPWVSAQEETSMPWSSSYHSLLVNKVKSNPTELAHFPSFQFPNQGFDQIVSLFPHGKVPIFGYGSLMNKVSLGGSLNAAGKPTVKPEAVDSMQPVIAFGMKRLFNYQDQKGYRPPNPDGSKPIEAANEKAYLNLEPANGDAMINGVVIWVDAEDLPNLVKRELGYDLVPVLFASWNDALNENPSIEFHVAYTFMASKEPRGGIVYTNDRIYPIRGYVERTQKAALTFGAPFLKMWLDTTYLADGVTKIEGW